MNCSMCVALVLVFPTYAQLTKIMAKMILELVLLLLLNERQSTAAKKNDDRELNPLGLYQQHTQKHENQQST